MVASPPIVAEFAGRLAALGWVSDVFVAGSLATGDYIPRVSDLDLVALADGPVDEHRQRDLVAVHRGIDPALCLGCVYVDAAELPDVRVKHPTWTHGLLVRRILSGITRAELARHGYAVLGRSPREVLPAVTDDDVRDAARAELAGYWTWAVRRPWLWLDPGIADLGLTSMARARHALRTGELLTKSAAVEQAAAPPWLVDQLRARRQDGDVPSPRLWTALIAWRDAWRTVHG
ncbi:hypothetical protein D5S17_35120 [Pseudonocardiaceae bacterium YIM PH 21723]|nr:hypothetical protein D5S17_35120 [Pseudonocardiaceae bacterium YIM PH 21723]